MLRQFPRPDATEEQRGRIRIFAEELDAHQKKALADSPKLTLAEIYNLVEKHKGGKALTNAEKAKFDAAGIARLVELHDALDAAVLAAYGWPDGLTRKQILARLATLNHLRAREEQAGQVRWLRPDHPQE